MSIDETTSTCVFREAGPGWQTYRFRIWSSGRVLISRSYPDESLARAELAAQIQHLEEGRDTGV